MLHRYYSLDSWQTKQNFRFTLHAVIVRANLRFAQSNLSLRRHCEQSEAIQKNTT